MNSLLSCPQHQQMPTTIGLASLCQSPADAMGTDPWALGSTIYTANLSPQCGCCTIHPNVSIGHFHMTLIDSGGYTTDIIYKGDPRTCYIFIPAWSWFVRCVCHLKVNMHEMPHGKQRSFLFCACGRQKPKDLHWIWARSWRQHYTGRYKRSGISLVCLQDIYTGELLSWLLCKQAINSRSIVSWSIASFMHYFARTTDLLLIEWWHCGEHCFTSTMLYRLKHIPDFFFSSRFSLISLIFGKFFTVMEALCPPTGYATASYLLTPIESALWLQGLVPKYWRSHSIPGPLALLFFLSLLPHTFPTPPMPVSPLEWGTSNLFWWSLLTLIQQANPGPPLCPTNLLQGRGLLVFQAGYHPRKRTFKTYPKHIFSRYENRP